MIDWALASKNMRDRARATHARLTPGQRRALWAVAERLSGGAGNEGRGVVIADDVGMGKTRVATAVAAAVRDAGGRVAIVIPAGLRFQWEREMAGDGLHRPPFLHTLDRYLSIKPGSEDDPAVARLILASHGFTNWKMGASTPSHRWGLLPALVAEAAKCERGQAPKGYRDFAANFDNYTADRAVHAYNRLRAVKDTEGLTFLANLANGLSWAQRFCRAEAYTKDADNRWRLERAIGLTLGRFDLLVIDEAHKSRDGEEQADSDAPNTGSGLSRLLANVLQPAGAPARLALTATPLALSPEQWLGTLLRIGVPRARVDTIGAIVRRYSAATTDLRGRWRSSPAHVDDWIVAARAFQAALTPYVIRRDKAEVPSVRDFRRRTGGNDDYRVPTRKTIQPDDLTPGWRRVILAAEGLSAAVSGTTDPLAKRLRTTLANGHGIAALVQDTLGDTKGLDGEDDDGTPLDPKQEERAALWRRLIATHASAGEAGALFDHPQLLAATNLIERDLAEGRKVLAFGRFSAGMQTLHDLLNARAKLLSAAGPGLWPAESLSLGQPSAADLAAARQLGIATSDFEHLSARHAERWRDDRNLRRWWAEHALDVLSGAAGSRPERRNVRAILDAARADAKRGSPDSPTSVGALVARAVRELMTEEQREVLRAERATEEVAQSALAAFDELVAAAIDADRLSDDDDDDGGDAGWDAVRGHLLEAFAPGQSRLARLLRGDTRYGTRRLLQAAFNRRHSYPNVLIAQSIVGREGLNLHEACRVVLQFHPEWNPGVVEQQIGRVDRLGSLWETEFQAAPPHALAHELPRIQVRSIVFGGTYDEHHWRVLDARHRELRAHLHGEVLLANEAEGDPEALAIVHRVNDAAPQFAPPEVPELEGL